SEGSFNWNIADEREAAEGMGDEHDHKQRDAEPQDNPRTAIPLLHSIQTLRPEDLRIAPGHWPVPQAARPAPARNAEPRPPERLHYHRNALPPGCVSWTSPST